MTNPEILKRGIADRVGNALLVKLNQIGTVTETLDAVRMARRRGLRDDHLAPLRRNRGHDDRRPRRRHRRRADQDRIGKPHRSRLQVQPAAADRRGARRRAAPIRRTRAPARRCTSSFCCVTARAPGTRRTASPAGPTSISPRRGREEAAEAGRLLQEGGYVFDIAYTSVLKRAIRTLGIALDVLDQLWIPVDQELAAERAALRRAAGAEQGGDRGEARRGAGQDLAAQLRHSAAAARRRTIRAIRRTIRATRG